jgi:glycosyltransferase involved in cell wall biosynthesis
MPKVSIVVPIYGVEKYIERCARSLFEQTFDDIEYIFVNDCTKDASIEVLQSVIEEYPQRKDQIKILHHPENRGLPQARKTGILAASGEYLISIDSDDWVDKKMVKVLYENVVKEQATISVCDIFISDGNNHCVKKCGDIKLSKIEFFEQMCQMKFMWSTCNKLIKRSLFKDVIFPVFNNAEDMALILQLIAKAEKISYVPKSYYYYYNNPHSITRTLTENQVLKNIEGRDANNGIVFEVLKQVLPPTKYYKFIEMFKWQTKKQAWSMLIIDKKYYNLWKSIHSEINLSLYLNPYITFEDKFKCLLTHLRLYPFKRS